LQAARGNDTISKRKNQQEKHTAKGKEYWARGKKRKRKKKSRCNFTPRPSRREKVAVRCK